ncbi:MAG: hypothetical protein ABJ360_18270 [Roseobacter sp.]
MRKYRSAAPFKSGLAVLTLFSVGACAAISARLEKQPVTRVTALAPTQSCAASELNERRLAGAYLRGSAAAGATFAPVLVTGRDNQNALDPDLTFNDQAQTQEVEGIPGTVYQGPRSASSEVRDGFGPKQSLPNVFDVSYSIDDVAFNGPLVIGSGAFLYEIPSSGETLFSGSIALEIIATDDGGASNTLRINGRFTMKAGYGSARGELTANAFDVELPFDTLKWTGLFLCGTRFVSSGKGVVTVQKGEGAALSPFKADRAPAAFRALFESSLLAASERPAPPVAYGGVFVIQSDNGTMTAVFLSDQVAKTKDQEDAEDA